MGYFNKYVKSSIAFGLESEEDKVEDMKEQAEAVEPEAQTTEEATQLDDSRTPAEGGTELDVYSKYRRAAGKEDGEGESSKEETSEEPKEETSPESETKEEAEVPETSKDEESDEEKEEKAEDEEKSSDESEEKDDETTEGEKVDAANALESLREEVFKAYQKGGMSEEEASLVQLATDNILTKVGMESQRIVASVESFSEGSSRRLLATSLAMDNIDRIVEKIRG